VVVVVIVKVTDLRVKVNWLDLEADLKVKVFVLSLKVKVNELSHWVDRGKPSYQVNMFNIV
jgi:hypothetical protein